MAEVIQKERLQSSLLFRLTDNNPRDFRRESKNERAVSLSQWRELVLQDLKWLLNTRCVNTIEELEMYPLYCQSTLSYGIPDLVGTTLSNLNLQQLEKQVKDAILNFEPRILPNSLQVKITAANDKMNQNAVIFSIEGDLWTQYQPDRLFLKTQLDLETGVMNLIEKN